MPTSLLSVGTAVPATTLRQEDARELFAAQPGLDRRARRLIQAAFDAAAIDERHTVLTGLAAPDAEDDGEGLAVRGPGGILATPSTGARNDEYIRTAPALFAAAATEALTRAGVAPERVTHVVTVSCTGLFAPGPDYRLVRDLGLPVTVERYHLGFVGCAAAIPALRMAARICAAQPDAVVLVACAELCSLHFRSSEDPQQIVAASLFADGAAAAVVSAAPDLQRGPRLELDRFATALTDDGEDDMVWTIGDEGFDMVLSAEVPRIVGREVRAAVDRLLDGETADVWAVHPGGRSVLDRVESGLGLPEDALAVSRDVLRRYGNMSSATILFILRELFAGADGERIAAIAFGPGLTVESAMLTRRAGDPA